MICSIDRYNGPVGPDYSCVSCYDEVQEGDKMVFHPGQKKDHPLVHVKCFNKFVNSKRSFFPNAIIRCLGCVNPVNPDFLVTKTEQIARIIKYGIRNTYLKGRAAFRADTRTGDFLKGFAVSNAVALGHIAERYINFRNQGLLDYFMSPVVQRLVKAGYVCIVLAGTVGNVIGGDSRRKIRNFDQAVPFEFVDRVKKAARQSFEVFGKTMIPLTLLCGFVSYFSFSEDVPENARTGYAYTLGLGVCASFVQAGLSFQG